MECQPTVFDLSEMAQKNVILLADTAAYKQVILQNNITEKCMVYADEHMLDTVIRNLITHLTQR